MRKRSVLLKLVLPVLIRSEKGDGSEKGDVGKNATSKGFHPSLLKHTAGISGMQKVVL